MAEMGGFFAGSIFAKLFLDKTGWNQSIQSVSKDEKTLSDMSGRIGEKFINIGKTMTIAGGVVLGVLGTMVKAAADEEKAFAKFEAILKSTGGVAGMTRDQFYQLSESLAKTTTFTHEEVLQAEALLLTFRGLSSDVFPKAISVATDLASALGVDLQSATMQLGKALQDPIGGMMALRRMGVAFTDDQKKVIKSLVESGDAAKAQGMILDELARKFAGAAAAEANTFSGQLKNLKKELGEVGEGIGKTLLPALKDLVAQIKPVVEYIKKWIEAHPELVTALAKLALGIGGVLAVMGPFLLTTGTIITKLPMMAAGLGTTTGALLASVSAWSAAVVAMGYYITKLIEKKAAEDYAAGATKRAGESQEEFRLKIEKAMLAAGYSADEIAKLEQKYKDLATRTEEHTRFLGYNITVQEKSTITEETWISALARAIMKGGEFAAVQKILIAGGAEHAAGLGVQKKKTDEQAASFGALAEATANAKKRQEELINIMKGFGIGQEERISIIIEAQGRLKAMWEAGTIGTERYRASMKTLNDELANYGDRVDTPILVTRNFNDILKQVPGTMDDLAYGTEAATAEIDYWAKRLNATRPEMVQTILTIMQMQMAFLGIKVPTLDWAQFKSGLGRATEATRSFMQEVSTVVADSMRSIAKSIAGLIDFKKLFGAAAKEIKFDTSPFDALTKAAQVAYDKIRGLADSEYGAQERRITRLQEDEDRRYKNEYDKKVRAIEDSSMTERQKRDALAALEIQYETAKIARDRQREDEKYKREEEQKKKLLKLEWDHEAELDKIKKAEDAARQKLADDEEKRQNSLWFKIKGIVATAADEMLTIFITRFLNKIADKILSTLGDTMSKAAKTVGDAVGGVTQGAVGAISGMWTGLGAAVGTFLGTVLASIFSGGPSGHQQRQQINDTKDSRNFLAQIAGFLSNNQEEFNKIKYREGVDYIHDSLVKDVCPLLRSIRDILSKGLKVSIPPQAPAPTPPPTTPPTITPPTPTVPITTVPTTPPAAPPITEPGEPVFKWQSGFEGIVASPIQPLLGEVPEYVTVHPLSEMKKATPSNITINLRNNLVFDSTGELKKQTGILATIKDTLNPKGAQKGIVSTKTELMWVHGTPTEPEIIAPLSVIKETIIKDTFKEIRSAQKGAVSTATELMWIHGTPTRPEIVMPLPALQNLNYAGDRKNENNNIYIKSDLNINGQMITDREYVRNRLLPEIISALESHFYKSKLQKGMGVS